MDTEGTIPPDFDRTGYALVGPCLEAYRTLAKRLLPEQAAQLSHYLKATGRKTGCFVNFESFPRLDWRRRGL